MHSHVRHSPINISAPINRYVLFIASDGCPVPSHVGDTRVRADALVRSFRHRLRHLSNHHSGAHTSINNEFSDSCIVISLRVIGSISRCFLNRRRFANKIQLLSFYRANFQNIKKIIIMAVNVLLYKIVLYCSVIYRFLFTAYKVCVTQYASAVSHKNAILKLQSG